MAKKEEQNDMRTYLTNMMKMQALPRNEYEHGAHLLQTEDFLEKDRGVAVGKFSKLITQNVLLGNISNDQLMRLYQIDITLLTHMFDMAVREDALVPVFNVLYYGWVNEIQLTRTKEGAERKHQATYGTAYSPKESLYGFGRDYQLGETEEKGGNPVQKLLAGLKRKG